MGDTLSKERMEELQVEYEANVKKDKRDEEAVLRDEIREIDEQHQKKYDSKCQDYTYKVNQEKERLQYKYEKALQDLEDLKQKNQESLDHWKTSLAEQAKEMKDELKEEGDAKVEKKLKEFHEKAAHLERIQSELKQKREEFLKSVKDDNEARKKLQKDHDEVTEKKTREHGEQLLKDRKDLVEFQERIKNEMKELVKEERADRMRMLEEQRVFNEKRLAVSLQMVEAIKIDDGHADFETQRDEILTLYRRYKTASNQDERIMRKVISDMEQGEKLEDNLQFEDTLRKFDKFCDKVESVHQDLPQNYQHLEETFRGIKTMREDIDDVTQKIENYTRKYEKALEKVTASGAPVFVGNLEIKEQFEHLRKSIRSLDELVLKFNIPPSNQFDSVLENAMQLSQTIQQPQISNGSDNSVVRK